MNITNGLFMNTIWLLQSCTLSHILVVEFYATTSTQQQTSVPHQTTIKSQEYFLRNYLKWLTGSCVQVSNEHNYSKQKTRLQPSQ